MSKSGDTINFKRGGTFYFKSCKCHIVEMIECNMVVFKWYRKGKQRWQYGVEHRPHIEVMHRLELDLKQENK